MQVLDNGYTDKVAKKGGKTDWFTTHGDFVRIPVVEDLHFDAGRKAGLAGLGEFFDGGRCGPDEDAGVAGRFVVTPFDDHFEVLVLLHRAYHAHRLAGAAQHALFPLPGVIGTVDLGEVLLGHLLPAGLVGVEEDLVGGFIRLQR